MKKSLLTKVALPIALAVGVSGCDFETPQSNGRFRSVGQSHYANAELFARAYHGGLKEFGADKDIDNDDMNDLYFICNDGSVYTTGTRRLIQGEDSAQERTFIQNTQESIDNAKKGEYESI